MKHFRIAGCLAIGLLAASQSVSRADGSFKVGMDLTFHCSKKQKESCLPPPPPNPFAYPCCPCCACCCMPGFGGPMGFGGPGTYFDPGTVRYQPIGGAMGFGGMPGMYGPQMNMAGMMPAGFNPMGAMGQMGMVNPWAQTQVAGQAAPAAQATPNPQPAAPQVPVKTEAPRPEPPKPISAGN